jgi:hypothetical protein
LGKVKYLVDELSVIMFWAEADKKPLTLKAQPKMQSIKQEAHPVWA